MSRAPTRLRVIKDEPAPPYSLEAEQSVLGALLCTPQAWREIADVCKPEDFYRPDHRAIFGAIGELAAGGKPCDLVSVSAHLEQSGRLTDVGGFAYLGQLAADTIGAGLIRHHAGIVRERAQLRRLQTIGPEIEREIASGSTPAQIAARVQPIIDPLLLERATQAPGSWPEPVNLFAELAAAPFSTRELPPELGAYPQLFAEQTGIDPSITLTAAVAAAAAVVPDQIQLCGSSSSNWFAQPRLWVLAIGAPGAGKSPGQREALAPLWALHREADERWRDATRGMPEDEQRPPRPRVVVGDATLEALSEVLVENPRGVLVATDEFDAWLGAMDQYRNGAVGRDRGEWLRLFDGGPHSIERVKRGSVFVPNWGVSILTATTPAAMQRLARHLPEDGLIQRFIVALARRQRIVGEVPDRAEIEAEQARYAQTLRRLWAIEPRAHNGIVQLSYEASRRFAAWRRENLALQEALGSLDPALEAHVAKYPTMALRLALTFHCARIVNLDDPLARDPAAWPVPLETLETALAFLHRASQHALALYLSRRGGSAAFELARHLARFILTRSAQQNGEGLQRRDLLRHVVAFRNGEEFEQAAALRLLEDLGWLRQVESPYQKAQPTRFAVNPTLQAQFAALAEAERERRTIARERIAAAVDDRKNDREGR